MITTTTITITITITITSTTTTTTIIYDYYAILLIIATIVILHSAKGGAVETGCSDLHDIILTHSLTVAIPPGD